MRSFRIIVCCCKWQIILRIRGVRRNSRAAWSVAVFPADAFFKTMVCRTVSTHGGTAEEYYLFCWLKSVDWSVTASCIQESCPLTHGTSPSWGPASQYSYQAIFHLFQYTRVLAWELLLNSYLTQWWVFTVPEFYTAGHNSLGTFFYCFLITFTDDILIRSNNMQQYAGIYLLKNHSLHVSGVHRTSHQENIKL